MDNNIISKTVHRTVEIKGEHTFLVANVPINSTTIECLEIIDFIMDSTFKAHTLPNDLVFIKQN